MQEFFPHQRSLWITHPQRSFSSLYVSRKLLPAFPVGLSDIDKRIEFFAGEGITIDRFKIWSKQKVKDLQGSFESMIPFFADSANYDEPLLSAYLSLLAQGQIAARSIPPLKIEKKRVKDSNDGQPNKLTEAVVSSDFFPSYRRRD